MVPRGSNTIHSVKISYRVQRVPLLAIAGFVSLRLVSGSGYERGNSKAEFVGLNDEGHELNRSDKRPIAHQEVVN